MIDAELLKQGVLMAKCETCNGEGRFKRAIGFTENSSSYYICAECKGTGIVLSCSNCIYNFMPNCIDCFNFSEWFPKESK